MNKKRSRVSNQSQEQPMNKMLIAAGLLAGSLSTLPIDAEACGATLFGAGQGSRFQAYRARVPADVLIYASPQLADSSATTEPGIQAGLKKAGHRVTVVSDADALASALSQHDFDVVIAGAGEADAVAQQLGNPGKPVGVLPIAVGEGDGAGLSRERYPQLLAGGANLGQFLKAINQLMSLNNQ